MIRRHHPPLDQLVRIDEEAGRVDFESVLFLRSDYGGFIPGSLESVRVTDTGWATLMERVNQAPAEKSAMGEIVTTAELAGYLRISKELVNRQVRQGKIPRLNCGHRTARYNLTEVLRALSQPPPAAGPSAPSPTPRASTTSEPLSAYDWSQRH
jgi:hypothetical protein